MSRVIAVQKREAKAALEAAGKLWEDMHGPQARLRRKDDEVYQVSGGPVRLLVMMTTGQFVDIIYQDSQMLPLRTSCCKHCMTLDNKGHLAPMIARALRCVI